jgi:4-hydroxy-L-threonine phosphate dehydrogenase PdxA
MDGHSVFGITMGDSLDFEGGVNVALGLPTAFDIVGKGVASTATLVSALELAARLARL